MNELLLKANGRIAKNRFWQGMVILTVASIICTTGAVKLGPVFALLTYVLIYPYVCVYGKRLHDIGTTAWWVIGIWLATVVLSMILSLFLTPIFMGPEELSYQQEMVERLMAGDLKGFQEGAEILSRSLLPMQLIILVVVNGIVALTLGLLPTQMRENKHGPVPYGTDNTFD